MSLTLYIIKNHGQMTVVFFNLLCLCDQDGISISQKNSSLKEIVLFFEGNILTYFVGKSKNLC